MPNEPIVVVPVTPAVVESEIQATEDEVDLVAEMVAAEGIQNELRHEQILEGVDACRTQLENLSTGTIPTEQPVLNEMMAQLTEIRDRLSRIESALQSRRSSTPNSSNPEASPLTPQADQNVQSAEPLTEEPKPDVRTKKFKRL